MENKTALMQIIDRANDELLNVVSPDGVSALELMRDLAKELLPVERQQIEDAFNEGEANRRMDGDNFQSSEDYYKNKYEDHDKAGN